MGCNSSSTKYLITEGEANMHKFFVNDESIKNNEILITGDDVNHISKVLRLRIGEEIKVSNGSGSEYLCAISEISKKEVICKVLEAFDNMSESPLKIALFQGLPKSQKMDLIIQKCVEIGVVEFWPVITERVVVNTHDRDLSGRLDRWNRISEEAAKQSNRGMVPRVNNIITFKEAMSIASKFDASIIPYENEKNSSLKEILKEKAGIKTLGIFIGPEGGFSQEEIKSCLENNISSVTLGPRILRTETAGFVAAAIVQYELGDMGGIE